ncbi:MAG: protocatechuate 3,4-dioxygenase subunit beta [Devosia sp.]
MNAGAPDTEGVLPLRDRARHPLALTPDYRSSIYRSPRQPLLQLAPTPSELSGPVFGHGKIEPLDNDLIHNFGQDGSEAIGQRLIVHGQVLDEAARPVRGVLIEIWQANAGGRYRHKREGYLAPLDPNFGGSGRTVTDEEGSYRLRTIKPGAYPWPNGGNDWRPAHIHFSVFGHAFAQRLITQMYFEGDPLIAHDPIAQGIRDRAALDQVTARLDLENTVTMDALAYRFDIVLRGRRATPFENRPEGS